MTTMTIYKLTWGAGGHIPPQARFFGPTQLTDAVVRFSEKVVEMDKAPHIFAAYAGLERLPDSVDPKGLQLVSWTKTSDERPTARGVESVEAVCG